MYLYLNCSILKTVYFFAYSLLVAYCYIYIIHLYNFQMFVSR